MRVVQWAVQAGPGGDVTRLPTGCLVQSKLLNPSFLSFPGIKILSVDVFIINCRDLMR